MFSQAEENYLKAIYSLELEHDKGVSTNLIAEKMLTKASSVTDMIRKLSDKSLVDYVKYKGVHLTEEGHSVAVSTIRKHRLWESFLVNKLGFKWDEVHDIAEQLEHIKSESLVNRLDEFLGFPKVDPHGDPIPDKDGYIYKQDQVQLSTLKPTETAQITAVKDSSDDFLRYLNQREIAIGDRLKVESIELFDRSMQLTIEGKDLSISSQVSKNILVKVL